MQAAVAVFLAHINPLTNTHVKIISQLEKLYTSVYIFPVRFLKHGKEINTKSFPFSYNIRKAMIDLVFTNNNKIIVSPNYTFYSPFIKYLPPLVSPYSWTLRNEIVRNVSGYKFISYTGDKVERIALKLYGLNPIKVRRMDGSASSIKEMLYCQAIYEKSKQGDEYNRGEWHHKVPKEVVQLIRQNWEIVKRFALSPDTTLKFMGMKFPRDGFI
jgi:hypothetical protein